MNNQIAIGIRVKTTKGTEGIITKILDGGYLLDGGQRVRGESIALVLPPSTGQTFRIGDRVTLKDKYMVRAADIGTVEAITPKGIPVLWDNNVAIEPNLKQPPMLWRTFESTSLEVVEECN